MCDAVGDEPAKALVKLGIEGVHDASWLVKADPEAFGISVVNAKGVLYLGAGGSDFLAEFSKKSGKRNWVRDTSGSVQVVEVMNRQLVIGGHFWGSLTRPVTSADTARGSHKTSTPKTSAGPERV